MNIMELDEWLGQTVYTQEGMELGILSRWNMKGREDLYIDTGCSSMIGEDIEGIFLICGEEFKLQLVEYTGLHAITNQG